MSDDIKYTVIKGEDVVAAMKASDKSTTAGRQLKKNDSVVWDQTVAILMERIDKAELHRGPDKENWKKNGDYLKGILSNHILATIGTVPKTGKNRQGNNFEIEKDGKIQWSSWAETRRMWDYAGTVGKILAFSLDSALYPEQYKVGARCDVLKKCVVAEAPIKSVRRQAKDLQNSLDKMVDSQDILEAHKLTSALTVNNLDIVTEMRSLIDNLGALLDNASDTEKSAIQQDLLVMATKHFA